MALSVVLSMTMGIIVDDTVHFLVKYQAAIKHGHSVIEAIHSSMQRVGTALVTTSVVLVGGFAVLTLSNFTLNAHMGLMSLMIIVAALLIDLIFLPAFISLIGNRLQRKTGESL